MYTVLVFTALLVAQLVSAGIYATYPTASTVLMAGRMDTVHWVDDRTQPQVRDMGPVQINLYVGEIFVATLANSTDPRNLSADVWISPSWRHNGSDYHIRFICEQPPVIIYTADFTITGMASISPFHGTANNATSMSHASPVKPSVSTTITVRPTAPPQATLEDDGVPVPLRAQNSGAFAGLCRTVDLERLKFRFVFIFWPTLIGITMAL